MAETAEVDGDEPFPSEYLAALQRLVPCDSVIFSELDRVARRDLRLASFPEEKIDSSSHDPDLAAGSSSGLTPREHEVLHLVAEGLTNAQIAARLWISPGTVRRHLENVFEQLGVTTRTAAVARAHVLRLSDRVSLRFS